ncbi:MULTISPECIES: MBL fold metallo-hydrolase [unclassified Pseudofrankia]|uniref:MBL fold metallo-hydrolase n=1 Tax=unclassified Pseudofrankia TaxID=2994372 RepID=UPI0012FF743E|nr:MULTISPECIES: MBL fold metallo-hydrolase [unclassified Pseudofrankia]MDT3442806.1 MBL fold metallo-hydrolase [Pseudofrankia sp. BMG5.37]
MAGAATTGVLAAGFPTQAAATPAASSLQTATASGKGTHLVLLGTGGGPLPVAGRAGISSALVVNGKTYVIDCGRGAVTQFMQAGLDMKSLSGIFLTHLHADHTVDYFSFPLLGGTASIKFENTLEVYGPGSPGALNSQSGREVTWFSPGNPFPGTADLTRLAAEAWAYATNSFTAEGIGVPPAGLLHVHEIALPDVGATVTNTAPSMTPFAVMENDDMKVTATLVPHGAAFPSFAYRFETAAGSVVFSGDTAPTANIPVLAKDANVLVHEVIDLSWFKDQGYPAALVTHLQEVHTPISEIGRIGAESGARKVVLTHFGPNDPKARSEQWWAAQARASAKNGGYKGPVVVGKDLLSLTV